VTAGSHDRERMHEKRDEHAGQPPDCEIRLVICHGAVLDIIFDV
jgi:hypothetical protein